MDAIKNAKTTKVFWILLEDTAHDDAYWDLQTRNFRTPEAAESWAKKNIVCADMEHHKIKIMWSTKIIGGPRDGLYDNGDELKDISPLFVKNSSNGL